MFVIFSRLNWLPTKKTNAHVTRAAQTFKFPSPHKHCRRP